MRRQFHDTWGVFWPARHVFGDYFSVRRDPHAQETISSQITACGANFMVPGVLFNPLSTIIIACKANLSVPMGGSSIHSARFWWLFHRRRFPCKSQHLAQVWWNLHWETFGAADIPKQERWRRRAAWAVSAPKMNHLYSYNIRSWCSD